MKSQNENLLNGKVYETPKCETIEVQNESLLCASNEQEATHDSFDDSDIYEW
ncbi:MAG TPA: hypothetical protein H9972_05410 [Candidatus Paraprevotella stercorigallinarum]|jgi:hypothetical protein|nr:hypothetical protein [Candidatus Paraprevotella stercorigallinarum]